MKLQNAWSRRSFLSGMAATGAVAATGALKYSSQVHSMGDAVRGSRFAFLGLDNSAGGSVAGYRAENGRWQLAATMPAESPRALAIHPALPVVYVAHSTELYDNLPRGSVSALAIDTLTGALSPLGREATALAATNPEHMAVSPDGRSLLVSSLGGSYSLFALNSDGSLVATPTPLKETGDRQGIAHLQAVSFRADGAAAYAADPGTDRISHLALISEGLALRSRMPLAADSAPSELAVHPSGRMLMVASRAMPALSVIHLEKATGELEAVAHHEVLDVKTGGPLAINQRGNRLYVAGGTALGETLLATFGIAGASGRLHLLQQQIVSSMGLPVELVHMGTHLMLAGEQGISSLLLDAQTGMAAPATLHAAVNRITGMAVLSL